METEYVWEAVKDGTVKAAKAVASVAAGIYEAGKNSVNIVQLRSELKDKTRLLGELEYKKCTLGEENKEEHDKLIEEIGLLRRKLSEATDGDVKYRRSCPACNRSLDDDASFCSGCGKKL